MKNLRSVILVTLGLLACGRAAAVDPEPQEPLTPKQIEELVSPIALYPDPLVALILPAATRPSDIVLAARFLDRGGDPEQTATEPWDESVKALSRYREVIDYLDENLSWTRSLGECFLNQPVAVMNAVQAVRTRAREAGLLKDTNEQEIIVESDEIRIVPANPTVIYVPHYDPEILYVSSFPSYYSGPFLSFGIGYSIGAWLNYDCDWHYRSVRIMHRPAYWYRQPDWRGRHVNHPAGPTTWRRWTPPPRHDRRFDRPPHHSGLVLHPSRPHGVPGSALHVAPSSHHRDAGRPDMGQNLFRPEARRERNEANPTRDSRTNPRYHPSVPTVTRGANQTQPGPTIGQRPPSPIHPSRAHNDSSVSPRREHGGPSSTRPTQAHTPPPPRVSAPASEQPRHAVQSRPAEPRTETREHSPQRHRSERSDPRRQEN